MNRLFLLLIVALTAASCGTKSANSNSQTATPAGQGIAAQHPDGVEVIYFHGKQRCKTCIAIERNTEAVVDSCFANEVADGRVIYRKVDISQAANDAIAREYEVTWSSLFVVKYSGGRKEATNLTDLAFGFALKDPEAFRALLVENIKNNLPANAE